MKQKDLDYKTRIEQVRIFYSMKCYAFYENPAERWLLIITALTGSNLVYKFWFKYIQTYKDSPNWKVKQWNKENL